MAATGFFTELSKTVEEGGLSSLRSVQQLYNHYYGHTSTGTVIPGVVDHCMHVDTISPLFKFNFSLSLMHFVHTIIFIMPPPLSCKSPGNSW